MEKSSLIIHFDIFLQGMLTYQIPPSISWSQMFNEMENLKYLPDSAAQIEDYSANEPSLEEVFLAFAREADLANPNLKHNTDQITQL